MIDEKRIAEMRELEAKAKRNRPKKSVYITDMELENINKLFLELSQFATATTKREAELQRELAEAREWRPIDVVLPEPFIHVGLLDLISRENCPDEMSGSDHIKDIGYHTGEGYWSVRGHRAIGLNAYTHWLPLPPAPQTREG